MLSETVVNLLVQLAIMGAIGYAMRKSGIMDDTFSQNISQLLLMVVIPLNMLAVGNSVYSADLAGGLAVAALFAVGYYVVIYPAMGLLTKALPLDAGRRSLFINLVALANVGYIGFPIVRALLGAEGALYTVVFNLAFQLVAFTVGMRVIGGQSLTVKSLFTNPMTLSPILAILIFVSPFRLPGSVTATLELVGNMSAPISMFVIGGSLAKIKLRTLFTSGWAWLVTLLRLVVVPLAVAGLCLLFGVDGVLASTCVIVLSMPSGTINVIMAERYSLDQPFATRGVVLSTAMLLLYLPAVSLFVDKVFL